MLGYEVTKRCGAAGLPDDTIRIHFTGSRRPELRRVRAARASRSTLEGDANDYVGKGLSGGTRRRLPAEARRRSRPRRTSSSATSRSTARPAARRSSAASPASASPCATAAPHAVVEGVGDHGCEYMTGGRVVVLGRTGRNFAAGMSGGIAYVLDDDGRFQTPLQHRAWSTSRRIEDSDEELLRAADHAARPGSPAATTRRSCCCTGATRREQFVKVMPRDYKRVLAARGRGARRRPGRRVRRARRSTGANGQADRFHRAQAQQAAGAARSPSALHDWREVYKLHPPQALARSGRALHGLRHPVLPSGLPARQPDPGLERPRLPGSLAGGDRRACTRPTTSRSSPAGSAPRRARARACSASTTTR